MLLPWEYGVRNLARRPVRTALTLAALTMVVVLILVVVGFVRGLQQSLTTSGDPDVMLVYSVNSESNIENSSVSGRTPGLLAASLEGTWTRFGVAHVSPEIYLGTRVRTQLGTGGLGLVRGVTQTAPLVRRSLRMTNGSWPRRNEVIVGKLAAAKLGADLSTMAIGKTIEFEGETWTISGHFSAGGASFESEIWCGLSDIQSATKRQDLSLVAMLLAPGALPAEVALFCKERTDLELHAVRETQYYGAIQAHYRPVRVLAWLVVILVSGAGVFAGLNMMYGAVAGRIREIATLQAIGYRRRAILISLIQEGVLLAAIASLLSCAVALTLMNGTAVRFTMGAFTLRIDSFAILVGCGTGLLLGILGTLPPALRVLRKSVAISLKSV